jgi:hypothetical protein
MIGREVLLSYSSVGVFQEAARQDALYSTLTDSDVIDEVAVPRDARRTLTLIGHNEPAARRIVIAHSCKKLVTWNGSASVPIAEDGEMLPCSSTRINPALQDRKLLKEDGAITVLRISACVAAALEVDRQQPHRPREVQGDVDTPAKIRVAEPKRRKVRVTLEGDTFADREANILPPDGRALRAATKAAPLAERPVGHDHHPFILWKHPVGCPGALDLLQGNDIGVDASSMRAQQLVVGIRSGAAAGPVSLC